MKQLPFSQLTSVLKIETQPKSFQVITDDVADWLYSIHAEMGVITVFIQHTSASLTIQENADPSVQVDLLSILDRLAPEDLPYKHSFEGPDDMPAHIKSMLTQTSLAIPVIDGQLELGTWQGIYLLEHRAHSHTRNIRLLFAGTVISRESND